MSGPVETAPPLLVMRGVTKHFGGVQALRGVDFDLKRGEIRTRSSARTAPASRRS